jgi:hypothetical protein
VRERYEKLQQKDLPGVMSTASANAITNEKAEDNDNDNDEDADTDADEDDDNDSDEPTGAVMQQAFYQVFPQSFSTLSAISI